MHKRAPAKPGGRRKRPAAQPSVKLGPRPKNAEEMMRAVQRISAELLPHPPNIDPGDVSLIVESLLRPAAERVVFLRPLGNGIGHVF